MDTNYPLNLAKLQFLIRKSFKIQENKVISLIFNAFKFCTKSRTINVYLINYALWTLSSLLRTTHDQQLLRIVHK
jgi:hypothetical protein